MGGLDSTDPELAKYLNRDYWEQRGSGIGNGKTIESPASPSAPSPMVTPQPSISSTSSLFGLKVYIINIKHEVALAQKLD